MEDTGLISQTCSVRKPRNPQTSSNSEFNALWRQLEEAIMGFHVARHKQQVDDAVRYLRESSSTFDICTATLRLGSSVSDHGIIFNAIVEKLQNTTPLVCRLKHADCLSLANIVQRLFSDFVDCLHFNGGPNIKKASGNFGNFVQIYKMEMQDPLKGSPSKRKRSSPEITKIGANKLVIIIEDVATIKTNILEDFCLILKNYIPELKVCLVFGISSTTQIVHKILSQKTASCLSIQTFSGPLVTDTLSGIFEMLVLNREFPFKLSPEVFDWLLDFVLNHDFSLGTLLHILKVCVVLHLQDGNQERTKLLYGERIDAEFEAAKKQHKENDLEREDLAKAICILAEHKSVKFRDVYLALQTKNFVDCDLFKKYGQLLKFLSTSELLSRLESFVSKAMEGSKLVEKCQEFCRRLLVDDIHAKISDGTTDMKQVKSRFELQSSLLQAALNKRTSKLDLLRKDVASYIREEISKLKLPQEIAFYNELYMGNVKTLKSLFMPSVRSSIHNALSTPAKFLKCSCCDVKVTEHSADLPNISLAYKLHLECGKMINTYDWLQSFQTIKDDNSEVAIAQFLRTVRELQVLGYVKPTQRKTDHMQRLTWGSC